MDRFETLSDCASSNLSSISGMTGFEDEFCDLKSIVRNPSFLLQDLSNDRDDPSFDDLQTAVELNEKYRTDYYNLETHLESIGREKLERMREVISRLETQLSVANSELSMRNVSNRDESNRLRHEIKELERLNNNLKLNLEEHRIDLDTKSTSVVALKAKIVELHVEIQMGVQNGVKLANDLRVVRNELNSTRKSEQWYKDRLHDCRLEKARLVEEVSQLHSLLISKERELNLQNSARLHISNTLEDLQGAYDRLTKTPEQLPDDIQTVTNLNLELESLRRAVSLQQASFDELARKNTELAATNADHLRTISERDVMVANLQNDNKDLLAKVDILDCKLTDFHHLLQNAVEGKLQAECSLNEARCEKARVEEAIAEIRDNFSKFAERFRQIQAKLFAANRSVKELEESKRRIESSNAEAQASCKRYGETVAQIRETLDREIEKTASLTEELLRSTESKIESETKTQVLEHEVNKLRQKIGSRSELIDLKNRLTQMGNRFDRLKRQTAADEEDISALKVLISETGTKSDDIDENVRVLKALCKAKESEMKEKERRYQTNYRTLLRKVKEHMRGRNVAEKHCKYLQELYDNLAEELNTSKIQKAVLASDLQGLRSECENYKNCAMKAKRECSVLKEAVAKYRDESINLEDSVKKLVSDNRRLEESDRKLSKKLIEVGDEFSKLEEKLHNEETAKKTVYDTLVQEQQKNADVNSLLNENRLALQRITSENEMLNDAVDGLKMKITCNANELTELREQKIFLDTKRKLEEIITSNLKADIRVLENDLNSVKSDKYFLQRLCNDLKFALTSSRNQSETLKKQMMTTSPPEVFIPDIPSPCKYDDEFINDLLKKTLSPQSEKPLYELHNNLNLLKKEMIALQKQVIGYNV